MKLFVPLLLIICSAHVAEGVRVKKAVASMMVPVTPEVIARNKKLDLGIDTINIFDNPPDWKIPDWYFYPHKPEKETEARGFKRHMTQPKTNLDKLVALTQAYPGYEGDCPGNDYGQADEVVWCDGLLKEQAKSGEGCLIYAFGVAGAYDDFTERMLQRTDKRREDADLVGCEIFAFDVQSKAHLNEALNQGMEEGRLHFNQWGLTSAEEAAETKEDDAMVKGDHSNGLKFYSLDEIMRRLGHHGRHLSIMRSDCEGCEYGWINSQMKTDPTVFERIDQIFMEAHFMKYVVKEKQIEQAADIHKMVTENFRVVATRPNAGSPEDRNIVATKLLEAGVDPFPCCREVSLIRKGLSSHTKLQK